MYVVEAIQRNATSLKEAPRLSCYWTEDIN
jgi:hypothetical protein